MDVPVAERASRKRRDEFLRRRGENAAYRRAALLEPADEIERLVGGDAAADDEQDFDRGVIAVGGVIDRRRRQRLLRSDRSARGEPAPPRHVQPGLTVA